MNEILTEYSLAMQALMLIFATVMAQSVIAMIAHRKQQHYVPGVVSEKLGHESFVFRSHRTFMNSQENLLLMIGTVFVAVMAGMDAAWVAGCVWVYAIARLVHMVLYYIIATEKNPCPRSYFYMIGFVANLVLLVKLGLHLIA